MMMKDRMACVIEAMLLLRDLAIGQYKLKKFQPATRERCAAQPGDGSKPQRPDSLLIPIM